MGGYVVRRLIGAVPLLFGVSLIAFIVLHLAPGDPAAMLVSEQATADELARMRAQLGLDDPLPVQYGVFLRSVFSGDFGESLVYREPVLDLILRRLPATIELGVAALLVSLAIGIPVGMLAAVRHSSWSDAVSMVAALFAVSMPYFWLAIVVIILFSLKLDWLPPSGRGVGIVPGLERLVADRDPGPLKDTLARLILPSISLGAYTAGLLARLTRSSMLEVLHADYVQTARAKGLRERVVINRHAFRNSVLPVVTVIGLQMGAIFGGAVVTETVFAYPGVGLLLVSAVQRLDYPVVQGILIFIAFMYVVINLVVDLFYAYLDPRIELT